MLQFGALGLLALVLFGLAKAASPVVKSLVDAITGLRDEVASFRQQQAKTNYLLALLLSREFGDEQAIQFMREDAENDLQSGPFQGWNAKRPRKASDGADPARG